MKPTLKFKKDVVEFPITPARNSKVPVTQHYRNNLP